jgi:hypothetical protein
MNSEDAAVPGAEPVVPTQAHGPKPPTGLGARIRILVIGLALLSGIAAWQVGEHTLDYSKPSRAAAENHRDPSGLNAEMPQVKAVNGALTFGVFGGLLGLALGLAGGFSRRPVSWAVTGAVAGLILGTAAGALPSLVVMPWQWRHRNDDPFNAELLTPFLLHLALWSASGLAAGLAFGIGTSGFRLSRLVEAGFAGLVGAMFGTFVFEILGALMFPMAGTANPFSITAGSRLLARLCIALCVGLGAIRSLPPLAAGKEARTT